VVVSVDVCFVKFPFLYMGIHVEDDLFIMMY
jgi:hypothetical protein